MSTSLLPYPFYKMKISDHDENREGLDISATCHDFAVSGSSFTANCTNELGALIANDINTGMSSAFMLSLHTLENIC
jgi:hypothetical protein